MNKLKKIKKYKIEKKLFDYGGLFFNSYDEYNNKYDCDNKYNYDIKIFFTIYKKILYTPDFIKIVDFIDKKMR